MYTIGQVAKFLGVSRDTLKFYDEKEIVKPKQDAENGYRKYNHSDIYDVVTTNFYREIDIEIKQIQKIRKSGSVEEIELILEEKEQKILEEIKYKKLLLKRIKSVKEDCEKIKQHLGKYTIKEMKPLEVKGAITDFTAYDEYDILQENADSLDGRVTLTNLMRVISFDEEGMTGDKFLVVRKVEDFDREIKGEILTHPKCIYTIIEDGRWLNGEENIDDKVGDSLKKIALEKGYELLGLVYVNILLTTYEKEIERKFIEFYAPIK